MVIAINTRVLPADYPPVYRYFIQETFKRIIRKNPQHEFIFISDRSHNNGFEAGVNVQQLIKGPGAKYPLLWKFWFDIRVPVLLRKFKADVFVSCDGICSLTTKVPQCLVLQDLFFLQQPYFIKTTHFRFYKKYTSKFLDKAKSIATVSPFSKQQIINQYHTDASRLDIIFSGADENFLPASDGEKQTIKNKYTEGKEYFVYAGYGHTSKNIMTLLKAFSVFKKRQQTSMKLIVAGKMAKKYQSFKESLKSYKYRNDIVLIENDDKSELAKIIAAAYAFIDPSLQENFSTPVINAMRCNIPVIIASGSAMETLTKGSALYTDSDNHTDIAEKMMLLYKDETLCKELSQQGKKVAAEYTWDRTADLLWKSICKAIS